MISPLSAEGRSSLLAGLESSDEEVRRLSVERLTSLPIEEAAPHLGRCLGDSGWRVRKAAVQRLVAGRKLSLVQDLLIEGLADGENPGRRNAAFEALVACGRGVSARLAAQLTSADADVRKLAVDALAAIADPSSREALRRAIDDPEDNVRAAAVEALGVVGGPEEIDELLRVATRTEQNVLVGLSALRALARLEADIAVASLGDVLDQSLLRPAAFELLGLSADPQAVEVLAKGLSSGSRSSREGAMSALLRTLSRADGDDPDRLVARIRQAVASHAHLIESCCERLESAPLACRTMLVQFLGLLADPRVVVPILRAGRDEALTALADRTLEALAERVPEVLEEVWPSLETDLRTRACAILGRLGGDLAERLLVDALASKDVALRGAAADALGQGGFFASLPQLVRRLEAAAREADGESDEEVRTIVAAIGALAEHPDSAATGIDVQLIEVLASRLAGAAQPVRLAIAKLLARLGRDQDERVLAYLLRDESSSVRRAAVEALARADFSEVREALRVALGDEASSVRIAAAKVLGQSSRPEAFEDLARLMLDEDPRVVSVAALAIGRLHRGQGGGPIGGSVGGRNRDDELASTLGAALEREAVVALAGLDALMEVGGELAGRLCVTALSRPESDVVRSGVACLGAHGEVADLDRLLPLVEHDDWSVRAEAVQVLSDRAIRKALPTLLGRLDVEDDDFVREAILRAIERLEE